MWLVFLFPVYVFYFVDIFLLGSQNDPLTYLPLHTEGIHFLSCDVPAIMGLAAW